VKLTVLIADDNQIFRRLIVTCLEKYSEIVLVGEAIGGEEAIRKSEELLPDVVILDISMPDHRGSEVCAAIKRVAPGTKVYLCSAHSDRVLDEMASLANADGTVRKSSLKDDLRKMIHKESQVK
jgi:DNA-binding NarL/FixJ family response regulator